MQSNSSQEKRPQLTGDAKSFPLSHGQQAMWFLYQIAPQNIAYNIYITVRIGSELDLGAWHRAWQHIVERHPILRTTYTQCDGQPVQVVHPYQEVDLLVTDASSWSDDFLNKQILAEAECPYNLETGPVLRVHLFTCSAEKHIQLLAMHHIAGDMWSFDILLDELRVLYAAEVKTLPQASLQVVENSSILNSETDSILPLPSLSYTDYVRWQTEMLASSKGEQLSAYWLKQLAGELPLLDLPLDKLRPSVQTYRGATHLIKLDEELPQRLRKLSESEKTSLYRIFLAAFFVLFYRLSGQEDVLVGCSVAGRSARKQFKEIVGYFTDPVVLRANLSGNPTFKEFLAQVDRIVFGALRHQDYPFPLLVKQLAPARDPSCPPLCQVSLTWQKHRWYENAQKSSLLMLPYLIEGHQRGAAFDLDLAIIEAGSEFQLCWQYNTDLFDATTVERIAGNYQTLLLNILTHPEQRISALPLLTQAERHQLLVEWNNTTKEYPSNKCIHQLFEEQVERTPDAVAVMFEDEHLTYRELNCRANQLAHHLQSLGVRPEVLVGICVERSPLMVVGLLGILKAGGAYVPLDPLYPSERLAYMLSDSKVKVLLTQRQLVDSLPNTGTCAICLDTDWEAISVQSEQNPLTEVKASNLAYIIYTSGSTGQPKGVMIEHCSLVNFTSSAKAIYNITQKDRVLQFASIAFDGAVVEIFPCLSAGGTLVLRTDDMLLSESRFVQRCREWEVTMIDWPTSHWHQVMVELVAAETLPESLRVVSVGGEAVKPETLKLWQRCVKGLVNPPQLLNGYGPTEATAVATYYELSEFIANNPAASSVPIGTPIENVSTYVLNRHLQRVPIGVPGELHIGGLGLARGYLGRPEVTAEKFIPNPFSNEPSARLYKTGDLVRYLSDGSIEFLGRIDNQVKIRGFRIELGEIEAVLTAHPEVREAVVIDREDNPDNKRLVAYVVTRSQSSILNQLRSFLKQKLPNYMVPGVFVFLDALPLTPNGKVDRRALPAPSFRNDSDSFVLPRTSNEEILVGICQDVLRLELVSIHDNFFELGGDSIISLQIIARANQAGLQITTKQLFQHQTIADLAAVASTTSFIKADQGLVTGVVPLTPIEHWFFDQNWSEPNHFNQSMLLVVPPDLKPALLEQVVKQLMVHHDALRMRFVINKYQWLQRNTEDYHQVPLLVMDLSAVEVEEQKAAIEQRAAELQTTLNLEEGPLLRVVLFNLGSKSPGRLLLIIHHLVVDGVSWRILLEDLATAYKQLEQGERIQLPLKSTSFKDWAIRLWDYGRSSVQEQELDYWLADSYADITPIPVDFPAGFEANTEGSTAEISVFLNEEETRILLQEVPSVYNTQINDVLLTALVQTFAQWTGSRDLLIELEGHGREELFEDVDLSRTVGWFTTSFPVRLQLGKADSRGVALKLIKEQLRRIPNRGIGYGIIRYLSQNADIRKQLQALPKPEVSFNYLGQFDFMGSQTVWQRFAQENFGWSFSPKAHRSYLLDVIGWVVEGKLQMSWIYSENIHRRSTMERLATEYNSALKALIAHCTSPEAGGYTPTDFPLAGLGQQELDELLDRIDDKPNKSKNIEAIYPLSPMQSGMLFHTLKEPESGVYFEQLSFTLYGNLNVSAFERAWQLLMERHPILRTLFVWENGTKPLQVVRKQVNLPWTSLDWRELSPVEQSEQLEIFKQADRNKGFELDKAPLMRIALIQLADDTYKCVESSHHMLTDGWCMPIIYKEVFAFYEANKKGFDLHLSATRPYSDYIVWLQQQDQSKAEAYWRDALKGFTAPTPLVVDRTVGPNSQQKKTYLEHDLRLSATATATLKSLAKKHRITVSTFVLGAWALLLSRYSGEEDVVFGVTVSGRTTTLSGVESMVGLFINTLPVRVQVESETELLPWLIQLQQQQLEQEQYSYSSLSEIQRQSEVPPGSSLFESIVVFENYPESGSLFSPPEGLQIDHLQAFERTNYPLTLAVMSARELSMQITYDNERFSADTIVRMGDHLLTLLEGMVATESQKLKDLPLLTSAESHQLLVEWNNTIKEYPQDKCIHQLFEEQVERSPDAIAVVFEEEQLTYRELNQRANRIAHHLITLGVGPEVLVGICVERSLEMVVGLLGILKAGGAYVPLDPAYPGERLAYMLSDSQVLVLLTQEKLADLLPVSAAQVIYLDSDWLNISDYYEENPLTSVKASNLAYIIYTSGTTGSPKGVMIEHRSIVNFTESARAIYNITQKDRVLQFASIAFDWAVVEIFPCLSVGATLVLRTDDMLVSGSRFLQRCREWKVTMMEWPTSHWHQVMVELAAAQQTLPESLRVVSVGGEAVKPETLKLWLRCVKGLVNPPQLLNGYGPTEATVVATYYDLSEFIANNPAASSVPIGTPIRNVTTYVLDRHLQPVPIGVTGELHIGGLGLARGYLGRPETTAEKFIPNPFSNEPSARLYKTGDLVRYLSDGSIEFLGRIDNQVKIRGFRIELGEIETVLTAHPQVSEAVVIVHSDSPDRKRLVAYVVAQEQSSILNQLRDFLKQKLPNYMVPSVFVFLDTLPLTPNGKVDCRALPAPDTKPDYSRGFVPPRDTVEQQLQRIWSEVLQLSTVGVQDNFFTLGGHSLLAMRLIAMIEQHFGKNLPLATLFSSPTIEQLASCLRLKTHFLPWSPLVAIQKGGDKRPFFCVPGVGGNITYLYELARHLGSEQPFYGLQALGLDGESQPHTRVEDIATYYIQAIQTVQPQGPYFLGGHSFGGQVAFEMATRLQLLGHSVALLAIIDAVAPTLGKKLIGVDVDDAALMADFASFIEYTFSLNLEVSKETLADLTAQEQLHYLKEGLIRVNLLPPDAGITSVRGLVQVYKANNQAYRLYLPQQVQLSRIALFRAQEVDVLEDATLDLTQMLKEPALGWNEFSTNVEVHVVTGNHMTMMQQPHVQVLAAQLQDRLEQAQA